MSDQAEILKAMQANADAVTRLADSQKEIKTRLLEIEQKGVRNPGNGGGDGGAGELTDLIFKSDALEIFRKGNSQSVQIQVPHRLLKAAIVNATGASQPLVAADRRPGIVTAPQRRFTIRDILAAVPTASNLVEFARELAFTNNAGPQGGLTSPTVPGGEGEIKPESSLTFELASAPVITIAHWIPASRQVLSDAPALQNHVEGRLLYGLLLEEEDELLNGDGTAGTLSGLVANATAFTGGSTNQTALDTLAKAAIQLTQSEYTPTAFILNPADWLGIILSKDTTGRYLFGDPAQMNEPRLWGLPVVTTNAQTAGQFLVLDAPRAAYIVDREDASVRIAEQHSDFFVRNLVVLLAEERVGIVVTLGAAMCKGSLNYSG